MSNLRCRYNNSHIVKPEKLLEHEDMCQDRFKRDDIKVCPYDKNHKINAKLYNKHLEKCPSKPKIDPKIQKEMSDFISKIKSIQNERSSSWNDLKESGTDAWGNSKSTSDINNENKRVIIQKIIDECKEMEYTEEDHIFLEAYIM